jgi:hypothetical protein
MSSEKVKTVYLIIGPIDILNDRIFIILGKSGQICMKMEELILYVCTEVTFSHKNRLIMRCMDSFSLPL